MNNKIEKMMDVEERVKENDVKMEKNWTTEEKYLQIELESGFSVAP